MKLVGFLWRSCYSAVHHQKKWIERGICMRIERIGDRCNITFGRNEIPYCPYGVVLNVKSYGPFGGACLAFFGYAKKIKDDEEKEFYINVRSMGRAALKSTEGGKNLAEVKKTKDLAAKLLFTAKDGKLDIANNFSVLKEVLDPSEIYGNFYWRIDIMRIHLFNVEEQTKQEYLSLIENRLKVLKNLCDDFTKNNQKETNSKKITKNKFEDIEKIKEYRLKAKNEIDTFFETHVKNHSLAIPLSKIPKDSLEGPEGIKDKLEKLGCTLKDGRLIFPPDWTLKNIMLWAYDITHPNNSSYVRCSFRQYDENINIKIIE